MFNKIPPITEFTPILWGIIVAIDLKNGWVHKKEA